MKRILSTLLITTSIYTNLIAEDSFDDFLTTLEETTKIATKNKINADYAPGIISILKYDDLRRLGARNIYDALKLIPNVSIDLGDTGSNQIVIRGIGGILGSGKTQILINGVSQNTSNMAIFYATLPIEIIERIEILRGPGSVLYGGFAFNGTINIITKKDKNSIFANYVKLKENGISTYGMTFLQKGKDFNINGVVSSISTDGLQPYTQDTHGNSNNAETKAEDKNFIANINYKDFIAKLAIYETSLGEYFGSDTTLPINDNNNNFIHKQKNIELSHTFNISDTLKLIPKFGYFDYSANLEFTRFKPTSVVKYNHPYNQYLKLTFGSELYFDYKKHKLVAGIETSHTKEKDNSLTITIDTPAPPPAITTTSTKDENKKNKRTIDTIYFQDSFSMSDNIDLNLGARYEKYYDRFNKALDNVFLPKIAGVYILDENNIFKLQYGEAYRPTTFLENKYSNPKNISAETIDTIEMQYNYKSKNTKFVTTLFYSELENMLEQKSDLTDMWYVNNNDNVISRGVELELLKQFSKDYLISSALSYTQAYNDTTKIDLADYSKVLGNLAISHKPYSIFSTTLNVKYIGKKNRDISDTRDDLEATTTFDITFKYLPKHISKNLDTVFGIRNIDDTIVKSPSGVNGIPEDYIVERRSLFFAISYKL